ncbi:MAG: hypothetical protein QXR53_02865 [Candidatus Norongarragalinales archaeon]
MREFGKAIALLLVLLSLFTPVSGISSEEAAVKAKPYLDSGVGLLPRPFFVLSEYYYVFAPSIYSAKKIFIAVSEEAGEVETDLSRLDAVGKSVYNYGIIDEYVGRNKISFSDMETTVRQTLLAIDRNANSLAALASKTQQSYPNTNFDAIDAKSSELQRFALELDGMVSDGTSLEQQVDSDLSDFALSGLLDYYKSAFSKSAEFIAAYDAYNEEISKKQAEIFKSNIPAPDNENIVKNLENMRLKVDLFEQLRFLKPNESIEKLEASRDKWVNDSIASFNYKKITVDVRAKYDLLEPEIETVFLSESNLDLCGLSEEADSIKSRWSDVQTLMAGGSAKAFEKLPAMLDALKIQYDELKRKYESCTRPQQEILSEPAGGQSNYLPWIVFFVVIAGGYLFWRYKQSQEETYS